MAVFGVYVSNPARVGRPITVTSGERFMNEIPGAAASAAVVDRAAERQKRLIEAQARRRSGRGKPFRFVMLTLGVWWLVSVLADLVITCVPGGAPCRAPHVVARVITVARDILSGSAPGSGAQAAVPWSKYEWPLLIISLIAALWVAKAKVYPDTDATAEFTEEELDGKA
jgi:hypothetical protein